MSNLERFVKHENDQSPWQDVGYLGFFGKKRDTIIQACNQQYGPDNWRIVWKLTDGAIITEFLDIFNLAMVDGYTAYFQDHPDEAVTITTNYSFVYDKDDINIDQAFDPLALYQKEGVSNQFHHVAINLALTWLGYQFQGAEPLQVRGSESEGYQWSPGNIPSHLPHLIPNSGIIGWYQKLSIEALYQTKFLQVKS